MNGVARCVVGYSGGKMLNATYYEILDHSEALLIEFDPTQITYEDLVLEWSRMHTPRAGGMCQYRSAVWYLNEEQKENAEEVVEGMKAYRKNSSSASISEYVEPATRFYRAEEYHQDYLDKARR